MILDVTKKYDRETFTKFIRNFLPDDFTSTEESFYFDSKILDSDNSLFLGTSDTLDLAVYEFCQFSEKDPRVSVTKETISLMKKYCPKNNVLAVFYNKSSSQWRFSLITSDVIISDKGNVKQKFSNPKRYSFLLGEGCKRHTPESMFFENGQVKKVSDLEDLKSRFSVESVTKEFYNKLFAWYEWALKCVKYPRGIDKAVELVDSKQDEKLISTHIIRLITRLIFVWFIKQKKLVPEDLFEKDKLEEILNAFDDKKFNSLEDGSYYNAILQNLFFATLNNQIDERGFAEIAENYTKHFGIKTLFRDRKKNSYFKISHEEFKKLFSTIPYLNGGLFECLDHFDDDEKHNRQSYVDGFSAEDNRKAFVPNMLFFDEEKGILPILKMYNFTVEESTPSDIQVALDPELLGKVFENLLGAYNPETKESARKDSGSFYTPREIVEYMVNESLKSYLLQKNIISCDIVNSLFNDDVDKMNLANSEKRVAVINALKNVKIFDPACGSGAFPVGMLNKLLELLQKLGDEQNVYELKLHIIQNCIYGSDIQPIAVQIAKLRFFISLICEQEKDASKENFGIHTLPNLETKIVCANSLIGVNRDKEAHGLFHNEEIDKLEKELLDVRNKHIVAKSVKEKFDLRQKDRAISKQLVGLLKDDNESGENNDSAEMLAKWNPYDQNASSPFFDAEWMFGIKDGFDIVIGNPPYIQLQKNGGELGKLYQDENYETFTKTGDIYSLFYERGIRLLKQNSYLCFITSNKWMRAGYGENTRKFFSKNNPIKLIDFAGVKIFDNATVDTNILLIQKCENMNRTECCIAKDKSCRENLCIYVQQNSTKSEFNNSDSWVILSPIEQSIKSKIEKVGTPLKDWDINIYRGVLTGCNEAFIISTEKRNEILNNCKTEKEKEKTAELIRPILRGRDIKRYSYEWADLWLIATFPSKHYDIEEFPAIKEYLLSFGIERLEQTGKEYEIDGEKIKTRKKTNNKWFETQDSISYWDDFFKQKICWARLMRISKNSVNDFPRFSLVDNENLVVDSLCFFTGEELESLINLLNSEFATWYFFNNVAILDNGGMQMRQQYVENIPLPKLIKGITKENVDTKIYEAFNFDENEISFIKAVIKAKKEEILNTIK